MSFFDSLKQAASSVMKKEVAKSANAAINGIGKGRNRTERFTFSALPTNVQELKALPEASMDTAFKTAALTILALCRYEQSPEDAIEMLNFLKGPAPLSNYEKQFIGERLKDKLYIPRSYLTGATPQNSYAPSKPYTVAVSENPYSFDNEHWATLYVTSGGADNPRGLKLRQKPSTGQWFLNDIQCLSEIRKPADEDPWA